MATKTDIMNYTDTDLMVAFYWIGVKMTKEVNSRRGLLKKTRAEEEWIFAEVVKRFGLDREVFNEKIYR